MSTCDIASIYRSVIITKRRMKSGLAIGDSWSASLFADRIHKVDSRYNKTSVIRPQFCLKKVGLNSGSVLTMELRQIKTRKKQLWYVVLITRGS